MTTRQVGAALGVNQATVVRDLQADANASDANASGPTHFHLSGERFEAYPGMGVAVALPRPVPYVGKVTRN